MGIEYGEVKKVGKPNMNSKRDLWFNVIDGVVALTGLQYLGNTLNGQFTSIFPALGCLGWLVARANYSDYADSDVNVDGLFDKKKDNVVVSENNDTVYIGTTTGILAERGHQQGAKKGQRIEMKLADMAMNFLFLGGTGSGKSTRGIFPLINGLMKIGKNDFERKGDDLEQVGMLVFDIKGDFHKSLFTIAEMNSRQVIG